MRWILVLSASLALTGQRAHASDPPATPDAFKVRIEWGVKIPLRDGVRLNATLYRSRDPKDTAPCLFTLTPYISQSYHDRGVYFAAHGFRS